MSPGLDAGNVTLNDLLMCVKWCSHCPSDAINCLTNSRAGAKPKVNGVKPVLYLALPFGGERLIRPGRSPSAPGSEKEDAPSSPIPNTMGEERASTIAHTPPPVSLPCEVFPHQSLENSAQDPCPSPPAPSGPSEPNKAPSPIQVSPCASELGDEVRVHI
jgi:hypothetical protein